MNHTTKCNINKINPARCSPSGLVFGLGTGIVALHQALVEALAQRRQTRTVQALITQIDLHVIIWIGQSAQIHRFSKRRGM